MPLFPVCSSLKPELLMNLPDFREQVGGGGRGGGSFPRIIGIIKCMKLF